MISVAAARPSRLTLASRRASAGAELRVAHYERGVLADPGLQPFDVESALALALQPIQGEVRASAELDVEHGVGEMFVRAVVDVVDQQACAATGRHAHGDAGAGKRWA